MFKLFATGVTISVLSLQAQAVTYALEHVTLAIRDHDRCTQQLTDLGFRVELRQKRTTGNENSSILLGDTYLELNSPFDPQGERGKVYAEFVAKREGAMQAGVKVNSLESAVTELRMHGIHVADTVAREVSLVGQKPSETPLFWTARVAPAQP